MVYTYKEPVPVAYYDPITGVPGSPSGDPAVLAKLEQIRVLLATPIVVLAPQQRMFLSSTNQSGTVIAVDMVVVTVTNSTPVTLEAADATMVWGLFALELTFSAACTLTIEGGSEDFVIPIPSAGVYSLEDRLLAYCQTNANQAMTITVSAGTATGAIYAGKGVP